MFNVFFLNGLNFAMWMCEVSYYVSLFFVVFDCYHLLCACERYILFTVFY
jgi:hypothetical protein